MWFFIILFLAVAIIAGGLLARSYLTGDPVIGNIWGQRPEKRLAVVEQTSIDGRRKLLLIRRDGVEHLIMTGGPVDVVVETNIKPQQAVVSASTVQRSVTKAPEAEGASEQSPPVFGRAARKLGHVVNE